AQLERIKLQAIANAPAPTLPELNASSESSIAAIGWLDADRPVWTWDLKVESAKVSSEPSDFTRAMDDAARAEFGEKSFDRATALYRQAIAATRDENQRANAQLGLARALWHSGSKTNAVGTYRELLKLPTKISDEYDLAYASYAVEPLLELGAAG